MLVRYVSNFWGRGEGLWFYKMARGTEENLEWRKLGLEASFCCTGLSKRLC